MARIGTVGYLNARPLSDRIDIDHHTLVLAHPAEVARMLRDGEVDVALVPVAAALSDGDFRGVPGVAIGADGPVDSVLLVAEVPPDQWRTVYLDGVSRTSVVLARLILARADWAPPDLQIVDVGPNQALARAGGDAAALVIGDAARTLADRWSVRVDLAEAWREATGLPFVFAVWAGRPDLDPAVVAHLATAGAEGVAAVGSTYAGADREYLTDRIRYTLDDRALMGLRRFGALAAAAGLVARPDLELYGPAPDRPTVSTEDEVAMALAGQRLTADQAHALARHAPLADLAAAACEVRRRRHPDDVVTYWMAPSPVDPPGVVGVAVGGPADVVTQLLALRDRQDRRGDVVAVRVWAVDAPGPVGTTANTAIDLQRGVALARLILDNVDHCDASAATEGLGMAQTSLTLGCDRLGAVPLVGDPDGWGDQVASVERHIRGVGYRPVRVEPPLVHQRDRAGDRLEEGA